MSLKDVSEAMTIAGYDHVFVPGNSNAVVEAAPVHFKSSSERAAQRKAAKLYRQHHRNALRKYAKLYAIRRAHHKPNTQRSALMRKVAQHYGH